MTSHSTVRVTQGQKLKITPRFQKWLSMNICQTDHTLNPETLTTMCYVPSLSLGYATRTFAIHYISKKLYNKPSDCENTSKKHLKGFARNIQPLSTLYFKTGSGMTGQLRHSINKKDRSIKDRERVLYLLESRKILLTPEKEKMSLSLV